MMFYTAWNELLEYTTAWSVSGSSLIAIVYFKFQRHIRHIPEEENISGHSKDPA